MAGFARLLIIAFLLLTMLYFALYYNFRANRRARLIAEYDAFSSQVQESKVSRDILAYEATLRRNLILGVYILPFVAMVAKIYFTNLSLTRDMSG